MPQRTAGRTRCGDLNHPRQSRHFWGIPFMCRGFSNSGGPPAKAAKMRASRLRSLCSLIRLASCWAWRLDPDKHISQYGHTAWRMQNGFSVARYSLLPRSQMGTFGLELEPDFSDLMVSGLFHGIRRKGNCRLPPSSLLCWPPETEVYGSAQMPVWPPTFDHLSERRRACLIHPARCARENPHDVYSTWR